ncbi:hypothetical protein BT69DRAFT_1245971 [Atractiella rhizophila]|nr:hypothetical protein BT69DRAFT_1245971 [Atractiella rhizophila]
MSDPFASTSTSRSLVEPSPTAAPNWNSFSDLPDGGFGAALGSRFDVEVVDGDDIRSVGGSGLPLPSPLSMGWGKRAPGVTNSNPSSRSGSQAPPFRPNPLHTHSQSYSMPSRPQSCTTAAFPPNMQTTSSPLARSASSHHTSFSFHNPVLNHSHSDSVASAPPLPRTGSGNGLPSHLQGGRGHPALSILDRRPSSRADSARSGSHRGDSTDFDTMKKPNTVDTRTQLFVGNLPFRCRWQDSKDLFRKVGTVLRADVALTPDNRSKGYGTVLFANYEDAMKAIETYNGFTWQGRVLDVRIDQQDPTGAQTIENANRQAAQQAAASAAASAVPSPAMWHTGIPFPSMQMHSSLPMAYPPPSFQGVGLPHPPHPASLTLSPQSRPTSSQGQDSNSALASAPIDNANAGSRRPVPPSLGSLPPHILQHSNSFAGSNGSMPSAPNSASLFGPNNQNPYSPYAASFYGSNGVMPPHYANRHLFVGNLPFNVQWQDLKDLFRNAGNILRADVTLGPDGRSRGFGTVLFGTPEDAQNAVKMYNGYEWNGRQLKVHFDKYSQPPQLMQHSPYHSPMVFPLHSPVHSPIHQNQPMLIPSQVAMHTPFGPMSPMNLQANPFDNIVMPPVDLNAQQQSMDQIGTQQADGAASSEQIGEVGSEGRPSPAKPTRVNSSRSTAPGTIKMPANPFHFSDPFSPQQGHAPLMTPSMPSFQFHPYPQTPPLLPHFLSPGLGPYSPVVHSPPLFGPNPHINAAPGAPVHIPPNHNPMFPPYFQPFSEPNHPQEQKEVDTEESDEAVVLASTDRLTLPGDNLAMQRTHSSSSGANAFGLSARSSSSQGSEGRSQQLSSHGLQQTSSHSGSFPSTNRDMDARPGQSTTLSDEVVSRIGSLDLNGESRPKASTSSHVHSDSLSIDPDPFSSRRGSMDPETVDWAALNALKNVRSSSMNVETLRKQTSGKEGSLGHSKKGSFDPWNPRLDLESEGRRASFAGGDASLARKLIFGKSIWSTDNQEEK